MPKTKLKKTSCAIYIPVNRFSLGLFVLWHINLRKLFNTKTILLEEEHFSHNVMLMANAFTFKFLTIFFNHINGNDVLEFN